MKYQYYQNQQRCGGLLLPFLAGALVSAPIAYLAGDKNTPQYSFPPYAAPQPMYFSGYVNQTPYVNQQFQPQPPINQQYYPMINQNPL